MDDETKGPDPDSREEGHERDGDRPEAKKSRRKPLLIGLGALVVLGGLAYGAYWYLDARFYVSTSDAYVQGNVVMLMPQVSGTVTAIRTEDTDLVHEGDPLVALDPTDKQLALDLAKANLAQTVREVRQLYDNEATLEATVASRQAQLDQARRDLDRDRPLVSKKVIPEAQFQHAQTAYDTADAALNEAKHQLAATRAAAGTTPPAQHPRIRQAEAKLRSAYLALARTTIRAPVTGYVAQRTVQLGQQVQPGEDLLAIVPLNQVWVDANFKETALSDVRLGQPVTVTSDFYGGDVVFHGHVAGLAAGTGSAFELLPPENATGNWIKIVRRVPVRIELDPKELSKDPLRTGLSTEVSIDLHDTSGARLDRKADTRAVYATPVYQDETKGVGALIAGILQANGMQREEALDPAPSSTGTPASSSASGTDAHGG
ncbi:MAG: HlyD family efflux transporter periplasmic adaptor subunit [Alphaproteobacteria bacterium]|nr:HlyD family efflux transporter periplasmic adaptor subunit [Alphaproteobacteria bacterium]